MVTRAHEWRKTVATLRHSRHESRHFAPLAWVPAAGDEPSGGAVALRHGP